MKYLESFKQFESASSMEVEKKNREINSLEKDLTEAGFDLENDDVKIKLLKTIINSNFDIDKVRNKIGIKESIDMMTLPVDVVKGIADVEKETLEEVLNEIKGSHIWEKLTKKFSKKVLDGVIYLLGWLFRLPIVVIKEVFYFIIKTFIVDDFDKTHKITLQAVVTFLIVSLAYGFTSFGTLINRLMATPLGELTVTSILAVSQLLWSVVCSAAQVRALIKNIHSHKVESDEGVATSHDLMDAFSLLYSQYHGKKIPTDYATTLDDWSNDFSDNKSKRYQTLKNKLMKNLKKFQVLDSLDSNQQEEVKKELKYCISELTRMSIQFETIREIFVDIFEPLEKELF